MFTTESIIHDDQSVASGAPHNQIRWRPLNADPGAYHSDKHLARSVLKFNSSNYQFKETSLACWASNEIGHQLEPCLFTLLVVGEYSNEISNCF